MSDLNPGAPDDAAAPSELAVAALPESDEVPDDLVACLSAARLVRDTRANRMWNLGAYERWCMTNGLTAVPSHERQIVAYLHTAGAAWSRAHRRGVALAIGWGHEEAGYPDPRGAYLRDYLHAHAMRHGSRRRKAVYALSAEDVADMVRTADACTGQETLHRARSAVLRVAVRAGSDPGWGKGPGRPWLQLLEVPVADITAHDGKVQLVVPGLGELIVDEDDDLLGHDALVTVLEDLGDQVDGRPLALDGEAAIGGFLNVFRRARQNYEGLRALPSAAEFAAWDDERWWWQQRLIQGRAAAAMRDIAWILLAWSQGARFADVHDSEIICRTVDDRWHLRAVAHKTDRTGAAPLDRFVEHLADCGLLCPACALADHVDHQARTHPADAPVFATSYKGSRRMTGANARAQLASLWTACGGDADLPVSTRSLRAGSAVTASEQGASLEQVMTLLRQATTRATRHYLRRRRPELVEVHITY